VLFLAWGIRVCYNVRNAESLFNEARLITYAIYNIAAVNIAMVAFQSVFFKLIKAGSGPLTLDLLFIFQSAHLPPGRTRHQIFARLRAHPAQHFHHSHSRVRTKGTQTRKF